MEMRSSWGMWGKSENKQKQLELVHRQVWNLFGCGICPSLEVVSMVGLAER